MKNKELITEKLSPLQKEYRRYFKAMLKKYGVDSPAKITPAEKKSDFFNNIRKHWNKGEGAQADWKDKVVIIERTYKKPLIEDSELQKEYDNYFITMLSKYGAESPDDLSDDKKSDFFNDVDKYWENEKGAKENWKKEVGINESFTRFSSALLSNARCNKPIV